MHFLNSPWKFTHRLRNTLSIGKVTAPNSDFTILGVKGGVILGDKYPKLFRKFSPLWMPATHFHAITSYRSGTVDWLALKRLTTAKCPALREWNNVASASNNCCYFDKIIWISSYIYMPLKVTYDNKKLREFFIRYDVQYELLFKILRRLKNFHDF